MELLAGVAVAEVGPLGLVYVDLKGDIVAVAASLEESLLGLFGILKGIGRLALPVLGIFLVLTGTLVAVTVAIRTRHCSSL